MLTFRLRMSPLGMDRVEHILYLLFSYYSICTQTSDLIVSCYRLLSGLLQMRNFMSFALIVMGILSRFFSICCRMTEILSELYNKIVSNITFSTISKHQSLNNYQNTYYFALPEKITNRKYLTWKKRKNIQRPKSLNQSSGATDGRFELEDFGEPVN